MANEGFKRKLAAILSADVIGYSRLMRDDEEATVRDLAAHRVLITEIIQQHNGRVVDSPGDNILAEFGSVVDACMSSKGFGQVGHKNKRGFQVPNTFFRFVKQPLMSNYTSCVEALYFS
jgi:class 3 adenylate cyclase